MGYSRDHTIPISVDGFSLCQKVAAPTVREMVIKKMIEIETRAIVEEYKGFEIILNNRGRGFVVIASNSHSAPFENRHFIYERVLPRGFFKSHVDDDDIRRKMEDVKDAIDTIDNKEQEMYNRVKRLIGEKQ